MELRHIIIFAVCATACIAMLFTVIVLFTEVDLGQDITDDANNLTEGYDN